MLEQEEARNLVKPEDLADHHSQLFKASAGEPIQPYGSLVKGSPIALDENELAMGSN